MASHRENTEEDLEFDCLTTNKSMLLLQLNTGSFIFNPLRVDVLQKQYSFLYAIDYDLKSMYYILSMKAVCNVFFVYFSRKQEPVTSVRLGKSAAQ